MLVELAGNFLITGDRFVLDLDRVAAWLDQAV